MAKKKKEEQKLHEENTEDIQETKENIEVGDEKLNEDAEQRPEESQENESIDEKTKLEEELKALEERYLRIQAEYQNYRKRVEKEKSDLIKYGSERLFEDILPIVDNFERALKSSDQAEGKQMAEGLAMIKSSMDTFFEKNGVKKMDAVGEAFDPDRHHAVMTESCEGVEPDHVIEILQDGYTLNDKVIRPCMVKVSC